MANFLDEREEDNKEVETQALPDTEEISAESENTEIAEPDNDIPDKYRNKSVEELVRMHQEAEKLLGRQGSEVGELRKVVDEYIQSQTVAQQNQETEQPDDDIDFFTDPKTAVAKAIDNHPSVKKARETTQAYQQATAVNTLQAKYPDLQNTLQDSKFVEWIKSSNYRKKLFVAADQQYDLEAADELFSAWEERKQMITDTATLESQARKQSIKNASTGNASGVSDGSSKKIYRRQDIIELMQKDPQRYQALQPEIMKAYAEKRVR